MMMITTIKGELAFHIQVGVGPHIVHLSMCVCGDIEEIFMYELFIIYFFQKKLLQMSELPKVITASTITYYGL
jgi:hypothetical protein